MGANLQLHAVLVDHEMAYRAGMATPTFLLGPVALLAEELADTGVGSVLVLASSQRHVSALFRPLSAWETHVFDGAKVHVPIEVVEAAEAKLAQTGANVVVAIGGGSPIGLGKALRLRAAEAGRDLRFVAVPTTYAGSEQTSMYGITRGRDKQTGRDERVRPELIVADLELTLDLPIVLTVQSLLNSVAHVASVLSTNSLPMAPERVLTPADSARTLMSSAGAASAARTVIEVIGDLIANPRDRDARAKAIIYASACAQAFDRGKAGMQHAFAHLLGGAFRIDHAPLHSILLPRFLAANPEVRERIEAAPIAWHYGQPAIAMAGIGEREKMRDASRAMRNASDESSATRDAHAAITTPIDHLDAHILALLARAGAPTTLAELGITRDALDDVLATRPDLPGDIARAALHPIL